LYTGEGGNVSQPFIALYQKTILRTTKKEPIHTDWRGGNSEGAAVFSERKVLESSLIPAPYGADDRICNGT